MSDCHVDVVRFNWLNQANNAAMFVPTMGRRPRAVVLITSCAEARDTPGEDGSISIAFSDGTNHYVAGVTVEDGVGALFADTERFQAVGYIGAIHDPGSSGFARVTIASFEDGGFIVTQDANGAPLNKRYHTNAIVFSGKDVQAAAGNHTLDNTEAFDAETVAIGFQPNCGIIVSALSDNFSPEDPQANLSFGAFNDEGASITNRGIAWGAGDNQDPTLSWSRMMEGFVAGNPGGSVLIAVDAVGATGFDLLQSGSPATGTQVPRVGYLALHLGDLDRHLATFNTPATTGEATDSAPAFTPQAVVMGTSLATAANTFHETGIACENFGVSAYTARESIATGIAWSDNVATSTADGRYSKAAVASFDGAGNEVLQADFVSFGSTGPTLNWTNVGDGTVRKFWAFTFGEASTEHTTSMTRGVLDVTNPPYPLSPAGPFICDEELQLLFNHASSMGIARMRSGGSKVFLPPGIYYLDNGATNGLKTPTNFGGLTIEGGGMLTDPDLGASANNYAATILSWVGGTAGPMFTVTDVDGFTCRNITFHGGDHSGDTVANPTGTPANTIDILTHIDRETGTLPTHFGMFERCSWLRGRTLLRFATSTGQANVAEWTWRDCFFEAEHDDEDKAQYGVFINHLFGQNYHFADCWWRKMNICISMLSPGTISTQGGSMASCHQYLELGTQNNSSSGCLVERLSQDGEISGSERQGIQFASKAGTGVKLQNVTYRNNVWPSTLGPEANQGGGYKRGRQSKGHQLHRQHAGS